MRTLVIDRQFRGVGRICLASGTSIPAVRRKYERMLTHFADNGRVDLLRGIRDRILTFAECYDAYRRGALHELTTAETAKNLQVAWAAWVKSADASDKHRISLTMSGRYLERTDKRARVGDLPRLLRKLRETLGAQHQRSFNVLRSAASAFVRDTLSRAHPLYAGCTAVQTRTVRAKRKARPLSPDVLRNLFPSPETDPVDEIAWGMAMHGMGQTEYWGCWTAFADRLHIEGTKRKGRVRDVPLVQRMAVPRIHVQTFDRKFRERTAKAYTPYDLRRTYASAMEAVEISRTRRRLYMGHGAGNVTDLYEHHEVRQFLTSDAAKLAEFFGVSSVIRPVMALHTKRKA